MRRMLTTLATAALAVGLVAGPALAQPSPQQRTVPAGKDVEVVLDVPPAGKGGNTAVSVRLDAAFTVKACSRPAGWRCEIRPSKSETAPGGIVFERDDEAAPPAERFAFTVRTPAEVGTYRLPVTQIHGDGSAVYWRDEAGGERPAPELDVVVVTAEPERKPPAKSSGSEGSGGSGGSGGAGSGGSGSPSAEPSGGAGGASGSPAPEKPKPKPKPAPRPAADGEPHAPADAASEQEAGEPAGEPRVVGTIGGVKAQLGEQPDDDEAEERADEASDEERSEPPVDADAAQDDDPALAAPLTPPSAGRTSTLEVATDTAERTAPVALLVLGGVGLAALAGTAAFGLRHRIGV